MKTHGSCTPHAQWDHGRHMTGGATQAVDPHQASREFEHHTPFEFSGNAPPAFSSCRQLHPLSDHVSTRDVRRAENRERTVATSLTCVQKVHLGAMALRAI